MSGPEPTYASSVGAAKRPQGASGRAQAAPLVISILLAGLTFALYAPALRCQFINFDDADYVTANPQVKAGLTREGLVWALTTGHAGNWHPLTWLSHMLDAQLFGLGPVGPHLTNLLLHTANTVLVFLVLRLLTGALWRSAFVAALFAWHPLHVESVAWVAERKDVLSAFFFLLTVGAYGGYVRKSTVHSPESTVGNEESKVQSPTPKAFGVQSAVENNQATVHGPESSLEKNPSAGGPRPAGAEAGAFYFTALALFALGLLSKPMVITLPFVLLLLDFWPLERMGRGSGSWQPGRLVALCLEKIPFLLLSVASAVVTFLVQKKGGAVQSLADTSLGARLANAAVSYARYLAKLVWPVNLALPYPHPGHWPALWVVAALVLLAGLTLVAIGLSRWFAFLPTGWLWFLGMLVPVIGLVQVGAQSMADRYAYLPSIGIFIGAVWLVSAAVKRWSLPAPVIGLGASVILGVYAGVARHQLGFWHDSESLFSHAVAVSQNNWLAHYNLAGQFDDRGMVDPAMLNYRRAALIEPKCAEAWNNLGALLVDRKQYDEAIDCFRKAVLVKPHSFDFHNNLGKAFEESGRLSEAIAEYQQAVQLKPDYVKALNNLAEGMARNGQWREAIQAYQASLKIKPGQPGTEYNVANALSRLGDLDHAIDHYKLALQERPDTAQVHNDLGIALSRRGRVEEAIAQFREARRYEPTNSTFASNLGKALAVQNRLDEALPVLEEAERLNPTNAETQATLGSALANHGDLAGAVLHLQKALELRPDNPATHFNLGRALASQGKKDAAIQQFTEALRLNPNFQPARQQLEALRGPTPR